MKYSRDDLDSVKLTFIPKGPRIRPEIVYRLSSNGNAAILFAQLEYMSDYKKDAEGWFPYPRPNIVRATGLSARAQLTATRVLSDAALIEVRYSGKNRTTHYRILPPPSATGQTDGSATGQTDGSATHVLKNSLKNSESNFLTNASQETRADKGESMRAKKEHSRAGSENVVDIKTRKAPARSAVVVEKKEKKGPWAAPFAEPFKLAYERCYGLPYGGAGYDYVHLNRLLKRLGERLIIDEWLTAIRHYFQTPQGKHSLADLAARYDTFRLYPLNKYKQPVKHSALSERGQANFEAGERAAERLDHRALVQDIFGHKEPKKLNG